MPTNRQIYIFKLGLLWLLQVPVYISWLKKKQKNKKQKQNKNKYYVTALESRLIKIFLNHETCGDKN